MKVSSLLKYLSAYNSNIEVNILCNYVDGKNGYDIGRLEIGYDADDKSILLLISKEKK